MQKQYACALCLTTFAGLDAKLIPAIHYDNIQLTWMKHQFSHRQRNTKVTPHLEAQQ